MFSLTATLVCIKTIRFQSGAPIKPPVYSDSGLIIVCLLRASGTPIWAHLSLTPSPPPIAGLWFLQQPSLNTPSVGVLKSPSLAAGPCTLHSPEV